MRARSLCLPLALAAAALAAPASSLAATLTVPVQADSYVEEDNATRNFGTVTAIRLKADNRKRRVGYVRFAVTGIGSGAVTRATLQLRSLKSSARGFVVAPTATTWGETSLTWNNAPALASSPTASSGSFSSNRTVSVNVTSMVDGDGTESFGLRGLDTTELASRERGTTTDPVLVIEYTPNTAPASTAAPAIDGRALTGERLLATTGSWSGSPTSYGYRWRRCDSTGAACEDISGATFAAHDVNDDDRGHTLRVIVTASNTGGSASATSPATDVVRDPMLMAAGDIACSDISRGAACREMDVSDVLVANDPDAVLPLGDTQYECGELSDFQSFYDKSWGRLKDVTFPAVGNHEYTTSLDPLNNCYQMPTGAPGFFQYFGAAATPLDPGCQSACKGYYSVNLGNWHLIALNSNCGRNANCALGTEQLDWLESDLNANTQPCTLAFFHAPRYSSGQIGDAADMGDMFNLLHAHGVDLTLSGHDHDYERFAPMGPDGNVDPGDGVRPFVVGTGGRNVTSFRVVRPGSELRDAKSFGVLRLDLRSSDYRWRYVPATGATLDDAGSQPCNSADDKDTTDPTTPTGVRAVAGEGAYVDLNWVKADDDVGVVGYRVERDGTPISYVGSLSGYRDTTVVPGQTHRYVVRAADASGNLSPASASSSVAVPTTHPPLLFSDGFESGGFGQWSAVEGLKLEQTHVLGGAWAARGSSVDGLTSAYKQFAVGYGQLTFRLWFKVISSSSSVTLMKFRSLDKITPLTVYVSSSGRLGYRNGLSALSFSSTSVPAKGVWHQLEARLKVGIGSESEVWIDGTRVSALSKVENFGTSLLNRVSIGDNSVGGIYDVAFDDVAVSEQP